MYPNEVPVRVTDGMRAEVEAEAKKQSVKMAELVRRALRIYLDRCRWEKAPPVDSGV